jgi:dTDP-4-dehydrorhamnose 3,5-epimerase
MKLNETALPGVLEIELEALGDERGFFMESWNQQRYTEMGLAARFVQDSISRSQYGVLRGLHFQNLNPQGKLVYVLHGEVFDVAVDIRRGSPTFGRWVGMSLSSENKRQLYIPEGFAHGFCVMSESALVSYKFTGFYNPKTQGRIRWNDPDIGIDWPLETPSLSPKDRDAPWLREVPPERLPSLA